MNSNCLLPDEKAFPILQLPEFAKSKLKFKRASNKKYKDPKDLYSKRTLPENIGSTNGKLTIWQKLTVLYLANVKRNKTRKGCFIKCDYLKELVIKEDLSYFILKIFPSKEYFLYIKNPERVQFICPEEFEENMLLRSLDKEEIPSNIFDKIWEYSKIGNLMYDYHCILKIDRYLSAETNALPVYSTFVLLKPTNIQLNNLYRDDIMNNNEASCEMSNRNCESKVFFDASGPLYLEVSPTALKCLNFLKVYKFSSLPPLLESTIIEKAVRVRRRKFLRKEIDDHSLLKRIFEKSTDKIISEKSSEAKVRPLHFNDMKEDLINFLKSRKIKIKDVLYNDKDSITILYDELFDDASNRYETPCDQFFYDGITIVVETFTLKPPITLTKPSTSTAEKKVAEEDTYLNVFWKDGLFYTCLTTQPYIYSDLVINKHHNYLYLTGDRTALDSYIYKVIEIMTCKFSKRLSFQYKNLIECIEMHIVGQEYGCVEDMGNAAEEDSKKQSSDEKKFTSNDQKKTMNLEIKSKSPKNEIKISSCKETMDTGQKQDSEEGSKKVEYVVESKKCKGIFEAHQFKKEKSFLLEKSALAEGVKVQFYPSLRTPFKCFKEDFQEEKLPDLTLGIKDLYKMIRDKDKPSSTKNSPLFVYDFSLNELKEC